MQSRICTFCSHHSQITARYCGRCGRPFPDTVVNSSAQGRSGFVNGTLLGPEGRFEIREFIGRGGFGETYLAEDVHNWRRACLVKRLFIKEGTPPELVSVINANFEQEARLLVELNTPGHPNIPEIYEYLPHERCLVMKYIVGKSLDRVLKSRIEPLPEEEALRYMRDACAALTYMHEYCDERRRGDHSERVNKPILHRDLKPSNIMLDITGRVFLIDFGLARDRSLAAATAPSSSEEWGGTVGYMPPEQTMGKPEPRSDVYALGATLYELVTARRPPALGRGLIPPRQLNPSLRSGVEQIILRCMAVDVHERPSARELLTILDELLESANIPPPLAPSQLPDEPTTVGRDAELAELGQRLQTSRFVAIIGMPGAGKTHLAVSFAKRSLRADAVFWHRFNHGEGVDHVMTRLAGWLAHRGHPAVWRQIHRSRATDQPAALELQVDHLIQSPSMRECLLCFDDVHVVIDNPPIQYVLRRLRATINGNGSAMLLISRTLPGFVNPSESMRLQGLRLAATRSLLAQRGMLLDERAIERLWTITEGNPELLNLAIYALQQSADPHTLLQRLSEADVIEQYLLREVDELLNAKERDVMTAVAVLAGHGGARPAIEAMLDDQSVRRELAALVSRQFLTVEQRTTGAVYYQHAMIQAFYYDLLGTRQRRNFHRRAAAWYEMDGDDRVSAARHYVRADDELQAVRLLIAAPWELLNQGQAGAINELAQTLNASRLAPDVRAAFYTAAGEAAVVLGDDEWARTCFEQALSLDSSEPSVRNARRYRLLAQLYERRSDHERAEAYCRQGLALAEPSGSATPRTEAARLYAQLAMILMRRDDRSGAWQACAAGLEALPAEPGAPAERAALLQRLATLEGEAGRYDHAISALENSLNVARQAGDLALTAQILHNLGYFCSYTGRWNEALHYLQESILLKQRLGDQASTADTHNSLGQVYLACGDSATARFHFQAARDVAMKYDVRTALAFSLHNLGQMHYEAGNLADAEASLHGARAIFAGLDEAGEEIHCLYLLGDVSLARGDAATALAFGRQALERARQTGRQPLEACALRVTGEALLALGDLAAAEESISLSWMLVEAIGDAYDQALTLGARARLRQALGDHAASRTDAQQALAMAQAQHIAFLATHMEALLGASEA